MSVASCQRQGYGKWSESSCPSRGYFQLVQLVQVKAACQWLLVQGYFVQVKASCARPSYLSKASQVCLSEGTLSKSRPVVQDKAACQWLLVQVMASCPRQGVSRNRLVQLSAFVV